MRRILLCVFALMFAAAILSGGCGGGSDDPVVSDEGQDPTEGGGRGNSRSVQASDFAFTVIYKLTNETLSGTGTMAYTGSLEAVDIVHADFYATVSNDDGTNYEFYVASEDLSAQTPAKSFTMERAYSITDALALYQQYNGRIYDPRVIMTFADGSRFTIPLNGDNVTFVPESEASAVKASEIMASEVAISSCAPRCGASGSATGANIGIPGIMLVAIPLWLLRPRKRK